MKQNVPITVINASGVAQQQSAQYMDVSMDMHLTATEIVPVIILIYVLYPDLLISVQN